MGAHFQNLTLDEFRWGFHWISKTAFPGYRDLRSEQWNYIRLFYTPERSETRMPFVTHALHSGGGSPGYLYQNQQWYQGNPLNNKEIKLSQFADDTTCFIQDSDSLSILLDTLVSFAQLSGLKINKDKSQILCPSNSIFSDHQKLKNIPIIQEAKILGIVFKSRATTEDQYLFNFKKPLEKIKQVYSSWSNRRISIKGKVTVANALLVSLLQYPCSVISTPPRVVSEYRGIISSFIWDGKHPKIAYKTLTLPIESGGLKLMDLQTRLKVNQLQLIKHTLARPQSHIYAFLSHLTGASDLTAWFISKPSIIHWQEWEHAGIRRINDICHPTESRTLSHQEIEGWYGIRCSFLEALLLRLSIPSQWRRLLSNRPFAEEALPSQLEISFPSGKKEDLLVLSPKKMYSLSVEVETPTCTAFTSWGKEVDAITIQDPNQWTQTCTGVYKATRETKLQSFHYKVILRIIPCNVYLMQIRIKDSDWCRFCDESDTIVHFLYSCHKVQPFWKAVSSWFREADDLYLDSLTPAEYIWGLPSSAHRAVIINAISLYVKHYIFRQKLFHDSELDLLGWLMELRTKLRSEKWICKRTGQTDKFKKWLNIYKALSS